MSDLLDVRTWSILQWVLVVLAAGFIGQFGKSFAQFIIAKVKARRAACRKGATITVPTESEKIVSGITSAPAAKGDLPSPPVGIYPARDAGNTKEISPFAKMEEVALPSLEERAGQWREAGELGLPSTMPGQSAPPVVDKKALKAILKQQKKATKSSAKASK